MLSVCPPIVPASSPPSVSVTRSIWKPATATFRRTTAFAYVCMYACNNCASHRPHIYAKRNENVHTSLLRVLCLCFANHKSQTTLSQYSLCIPLRVSVYNFYCSPIAVQSDSLCNCVEAIEKFIKFCVPSAARNLNWVDESENRRNRNRKTAHYRLPTPEEFIPLWIFHLISLCEFWRQRFVRR